MDRLFSTIERLRRLPEPARRQLLWLLVAGTCALIGVAWAGTLGWQLRRSAQVAALAPQEGGERLALPGISENLRRSALRVGAALRDALRAVILEEQGGADPAPRRP